MRCNFLLLLVTVAAAVPLLCAAAENWQPIKNINDPAIKDLAKFALDTNNSRYKTALKLISVNRGDFQTEVGDTYYRIMLTATDGSGTYNLEADVVVSSSGRVLVSLKPVRS